MKPSQCQHGPSTPEKRTIKANNYGEHWQYAQRTVVNCFARDVVEARFQKRSGGDLFYIGRIPCSFAKVVGMVVGVSDFERDYDSGNVVSGVTTQVDDGTALIDYIQMKTWNRSRTSPTKKASNERPHVFLNPGDIAICSGRIEDYKGTRQLKGDCIGQSSPTRSRHQQLSDYEEAAIDPNAESKYWREVSKIHEDNYQSMEPFLLPGAIPVPATPPRTPEKSSTPASPFIPSPEASSSTACSSAAGSPISEPGQHSLLSHPSRLSSKQLKFPTFRIYLQYYMQRIPPDLAEDCDEEFDPLATPTARRSSSSAVARTPRPAQAIQISSAPTASQAAFGRRVTQTDAEPAEAITTGFTVSRLRRVPELDLLARRVILAEQKVKDKEARRRWREARAQARSKRQSSQVSASLSDGKPQPTMLSEVHIRRAVKNMFNRAVGELFNDGAIVYHSGAKRAFPVPRWSMYPEATTLWKVRSSHKEDDSTSMATSETHEAASTSASVSITHEAGYLSEEDEDEDAIVLLTTDILITQVAQSMKAMQFASAATRRKHMVPGDDPIYAGKARPPSPGEIVIWLAKDEVWNKIGEVPVLNALKVMEGRREVRRAGNGRWELILSRARR